MVELGDLIGHLLCEISRARMRADIESVNIAKLYASSEEPLYVGLTVPRIRLPSVEITLPVGVLGVPDGHSERISFDAEMLAEAIIDEIEKPLRSEGFRIDISDILKTINENVALSTGTYNKEVGDALGLGIAGKLQRRVRSGAGKKELTENAFQTVIEVIRERIEHVFSALPRKAKGIEIEARANALKDVVPPDRLMMIKLNIVEEMLEIHKIQNKDGDVTFKLLPE